MTRVGPSAWFFNLNSIGFIFLLLFINHAAIFVKSEAGCAISCGKLNIVYPFRLQDDPTHCGTSDYELVCENGKAFFYMDAHKYLVTYIGYGKATSYAYLGIIYSGNITILVDCPFTTNTCRLHDIASYNFRPPGIYTFVSFMNCLQKVENEEGIQPVILSNDTNTTYYAIVGEEANKISGLRKSCKFVDSFIIAMNSSRQVIDILQEGFNLHWSYYDFGTTNESCWTVAFRKAKLLLLKQPKTNCNINKDNQL